MDREAIPAVDPNCATSNAVLAQIAAATGPLPRITLRAQLRLNNQRLGTALQELERLGRIRRTTQGWTMAETAHTPRSVPASKACTGPEHPTSQPDSPGA